VPRVRVVTVTRSPPLMETPVCRTVRNPSIVTSTV
jgi:hypothetical protein